VNAAPLPKTQASQNQTPGGFLASSVIYVSPVRSNAPILLASVLAPYGGSTPKM
jgi:hypothetical protein